MSSIFIILMTIFAVMAVILVFIVIAIFKIISTNDTTRQTPQNKLNTEEPNRFNLLDKGQYGEFLTYNIISQIAGFNYLLHNIYLPKSDGTTTEIDLLLIHPTGIYVFESKNYSGWIFGNEKTKNWTQTLSNGQKNSFLSPIYQNRGHIYRRYQLQNRKFKTRSLEMP